MNDKTTFKGERAEGRGERGKKRKAEGERYELLSFWSLIITYLKFIYYSSDINGYTHFP